MPTKALVNNDYIMDQDASVPFISPEFELTLPIESLNYQIRYDEGVAGLITWQGTIDGINWETLDLCEPVTLTIDGLARGSDIISILKIWETISAIRFTWGPAGASPGNINVSLRIGPI